MTSGPKKRILIAGATGVGKTWLLAAFERAALQNRADQPRITFSPVGLRKTDHVEPGEDPPLILEAGNTYLRAAADFFLRGKDLDATLGRGLRYGFNLGVQRSGNEEPETFEFLDAPGEFTSPYQAEQISPERQALLDEARQGYALVFCFESLSREQPAEALWNLEANLSNLLRNLQTARGWINYERILFLLTKIDVLTSVFYDRMEKQHFAAPITPLMLAQRIDPLEQMRAIVGSESISKFFAPGSNVEVAVGISSAIGFDSETGKPMASPYSGYPLPVKGRSPEQHYLRWTPFGVRESLLFLATGETYSTVRKIVTGDADHQDLPSIAVVPYRSRS